MTISFKDHISQCSYVIITCEECGDKLPRGDQHSHVTTICPQRKIECKFCNIFVLAENYEVIFELKHQSDELKTLIFVQKHLINECPDSLVDCPHKCGLVRRSGKEVSHFYWFLLCYQFKDICIARLLTTWRRANVSNSVCMGVNKR